MNHFRKPSISVGLVVIKWHINILAVEWNTSWYEKYENFQKEKMKIYVEWRRHLMQIFTIKHRKLIPANSIIPHENKTAILSDHFHDISWNEKFWKDLFSWLIMFWYVGEIFFFQLFLKIIVHNASNFTIKEKSFIQEQVEKKISDRFHWDSNQRFVVSELMPLVRLTLDTCIRIK